MCRDSRKGSILVVMLWLLMVISLFCMAFAKTMRVETQTATNNLQSIKCNYLARAGISETVYRLVVYTMESSGRIYGQQVEELEPLDIELGRVVLHTDIGDATVEIADENGKIHLNHASKELLLSLLAALGVAQERADAISDSILDWRDPDDDHHLNGAEEPEYQAANLSYKPRNANFESTEELLLVKGVDKDLFYGHFVKSADGTLSFMPGLNKCLTVFGAPAGINVNSAPFNVLLAVGFPPDMAMEIIRERAIKPFRDNQDFSTRVPNAPGMDQLKTPVITRSPVQSAYFSLSSTGVLKDSKVKKSVYCVVKLDAAAPMRHSIVYWNESYFIQEEKEQ